jgi:hypothetical protein
MAMARANELANLKIVVEKWDSSKIGGKRGGSKGKPGGAKGYTTARAGTSNTRAAAQDAASSIHDQVAGMPDAAQLGGSSSDIDGGCYDCAWLSLTALSTVTRNLWL